MTPNSDQSLDEYTNIKNCSNCGRFETWKIVYSKGE